MKLSLRTSGWDPTRRMWHGLTSTQQAALLGLGLARPTRDGVDFGEALAADVGRVVRAVA